MNKQSGFYKNGKSHAEGGIPVLVDDNTLIEVEKFEYVICNNAMNSTKIFEFKNKTNKEILDEIFRYSDCEFEQHKANSGDFIICKLAVMDKKKRNITGTAKEIINVMQSEKSCNVTNDSKEFKDGGSVNNTNLLAPNGKPSNLNEIQYHLVRTPEFKAWFGDWENNPINSSKVVDENGEPLVVYHGTKSFDINEFNLSKSKRISSGLKEFGTFFTDNKKLAEFYRDRSDLKKEEITDIDKEIYKWKKILNQTRNNRDYDYAEQQIKILNEFKKGKIYSVFLNLKKMYSFDAKKGINIEAWNNLEVKTSYKLARNRDAMDFLKEGKFGVEKVDGIQAKNIIDALVQTEELKKELLSNVYLVFDSKNIKLADGTNTTFDTNNDDIRYAKGGEIENDETYTKWKNLVNMSKSELEKFYESKEGKEAGLSSSEAKEQGISSGRESARWIMKMKDTPKSEWTPTMWKWANKQISFISRMSGMKGDLYDDKGNKTRKHTSLLIWGHNPKKYEDGGELSINNEITVFDETKYDDNGKDCYWKTYIYNDSSISIDYCLGDFFKIDSIGTKEKSRRSGDASKLIDYAKEIALQNNFDKIDVYLPIDENTPRPEYTLEDYKKAVSFYKKNGFEFYTNSTVKMFCDLNKILKNGGELKTNEMKPIRFEAGKKLTETEKKDIYKNLNDSYKVKHRPFTEENDRIVWLDNASDYMTKSDITGRLLRWYIYLPDGRIAHPTEVFGASVTMSEIDRVQKNIEQNEFWAKKEYDQVFNSLKKQNEIKKVVDAIDTAITNGAKFKEEYDSDDLGKRNKRVRLLFSNGNNVSIPEYVINTRDSYLGLDVSDLVKHRLGEIRNKYLNFQLSEIDWEKFYNENKTNEMENKENIINIKDINKNIFLVRKVNPKKYRLLEGLYEKQNEKFKNSEFYFLLGKDSKIVDALNEKGFFISNLENLGLTIIVDVDRKISQDLVNLKHDNIGLTDIGIEAFIEGGYNIVKNETETLQGGKADKLTIEDIAKKHNVSLEYAKEQLNKGMNVESEHTKDTEKQKEIALDHLSEFIEYYNELDKMEEKLKQEEENDTLSIAIQDVISLHKYGNLDLAEAKILYTLNSKILNEDDNWYYDSITQKDEIQKELYNMNYITDDTEDGKYDLSEFGKDFIKAVNARVETLKSVKQGIDLFPEEANITEHKADKVYDDIKSCLISEGDDENSYIFEGKEFINSESGHNERWKFVNFFKYGTTVEHIAKNKLTTKKESIKLTFDELRQMYKDDDISIDGIKDYNSLNNCLKLLTKCIDVIDANEATKNEIEKHNETKKELRNYKIEKQDSAKKERENREMADELMILNKNILDSLSIESNSDLYKDKGLQLKYKEAMDKYMFTAIPNDKFPLDYKIHDILEDENEHLLNQHLYLSGSFGEKEKTKWIEFLNKVKPGYKDSYLDKDVYEPKTETKKEQSNEQKELKEAINTFEELIKLGGTDAEIKEWQEAIDTFKMLLDEEPTNKNEYDKAFKKMYKKVIYSDKSIKEQNKLIDNWIKENAPKYGIEQFAKGGNVEKQHSDLEKEIMESQFGNLD